MKREFTPYFEEVFKNYKYVYMQFMEHTEDSMPDDETLLIIALNSDADTMLADMAPEKDGEV